MNNRTAHLALYDTLADWEVGHLVAELHTGRFTGTSVDVVTVAETREPITTMGGVRMLPMRCSPSSIPPTAISSSSPVP